jgi:glycosyltransferase involved in cell wall biosynthesis
VGGLSVSLYEFANHLCTQGAIVDIVTPPRTDETSSEHPNVITHSLGGKLVLNQSLDSRDRNFFDKYDFVVSLNNFGLRSLSTVVDKRRIIRWIHSVASDRSLSTYVPLNPTFFDYIRMYYLRRKEISLEHSIKGIRTFCVSRYAMKKVIDYGIEEPERTAYLPAGTDTTKFRPVYCEKKFDLIFVGRFQKMKGLDILMKALTFLVKREVKLRLAIVGNFDEGQRNFCLRLTSNEARKLVKFVGLVNHDKLPLLLNSSKLLVIPSRYESFGLPAIEALACGIPVVSSDVGGLPEVVDPKVGSLFNGGSAVSLAKVIEQTFRRRVEFDTALENGPSSVALFDWEVITDKFLRKELAAQNS